MKAIITSCASIEERQKVLDITRRHKGFVFSTMGLSPGEVPKLSMGDINEYISFIRTHNDEIVGVGEVGLDYHWVKSKRQQEETKLAFKLFIDLANELKKPIVIHNRDATKDTFDILRKANVPVMLHCYSSNLEYLEEANKRGYYISMNTILCKSKSRQKLIKHIPLDHLILETDAPWLDPIESGMVNKPWKISFAADVIAQKLDLLTEQVINHATKNTKKIFKLRV